MRSGGFTRGRSADPEVDRATEAATAALDEGAPRQFSRRAQHLIAADAPGISVWVKTSVAVAQPDLEGIVLSPIADFGFFAGVRRVR